MVTLTSQSVYSNCKEMKFEHVGIKHEYYYRFNIVTWMVTAFLGNGQINMLPWIMQQYADCLLCGPCRGVSKCRFFSLNKLRHRLLHYTRVEAGSNTSTVTLRVVGGDEKGSLKSETVKYGRKSQGTTTEKDCAGKDQRHIQKTDPSSRQRGRPTE
jgi:hypothetical protein